MSPKKFVIIGCFKIFAFFLAFLFCTTSFTFSSFGTAEEEARVYFLHALKSKQEGNFLAAENLFRKAIEIEPNNPDYHFELGNLYADRKNPVEARLAYERAVMIAPDHVAANYNLGLVYAELGYTGEARNRFRKVLELDPQNVRAQLQIGYTYADEGFSDDARQAFETAREMDPTDPEPQTALEDLGQLEQQSRSKSETALNESLMRNERSLYSLRNQPAPPTQVSGKDALVQAGVLLVQQLFNQRSQKNSEGGKQ